MLYKRPPAAVPRLSQCADLRGTCKRLLRNRVRFLSLVDEEMRDYRQADSKPYGKYSASYAGACVSRTADRLLCQTLLTWLHVPVGKAEACYN
jgi:hypothetical protein